MTTTAKALVGSQGFPAAYALEIARRVLAWLEPACAEVHIAGSLRRERPQVKDVELVACLHDADAMPLHLAEHAINQAILQRFHSEELLLDAKVRRNGPRYKRFITPDAPDIPIELFIAERGNFGNILAIRTGDAEFSRRMVTPLATGGLMPAGYRQKDGFLWVTHVDGRILTTPRRIDCPTEESFFATLGVPALPPSERDIAAIDRLRAGIGR